jgi:hypothetical protein
MSGNLSAPPLVMRGLDPRIHLLREMSFFKRWIAGSSPAMTSSELVRFIAMPMTAPSPLVGEGITAARPELGRVRGSLHELAMWSQPLTRLRFAKADAEHRRPNLRTAAKAAYASPIRREEKRPAVQRRQTS